MLKTFEKTASLLREVPDISFELMGFAWVYEALRRSRWNRTIAAEKLRIDRRTLTNYLGYITALGIEIPKCDRSSERRGRNAYDYPKGQKR